MQVWLNTRLSPQRNEGTATLQTILAESIYIPPSLHQMNALET